MGSPIYGNPQKRWKKVWENMDGIFGSTGESFGFCMDNFFGKKNPHFMDFNMGLPVLRETISSL